MAGSQTTSETTGFILTQTQKYIVTAFIGISWYNSIELIVLCFATFKRYEGLYFWSLLVASSSLIPYCLGFVLFFFVASAPSYLSITFILLGWYCMVTGHSMVLWSRLHLVLLRQKVLRALLYLIIINSILLEIPITVLIYGTLSPEPDAFIRGYKVMEHIQLIGFCFQESLISTIYIWETFKLLRLRPQGQSRRILAQLLVINVAILILDVAVVAVEYADLYGIQVMFKPVAYSIKLRLEYAILGRLVVIATHSCSPPEVVESSAQGLNPAPLSARGLSVDVEARREEMDISSISLGYNNNNGGPISPPD